MTHYRFPLKEIPNEPNPPITYAGLLMMLLQAPKNGVGIGKLELKLRMQAQRQVLDSHDEAVFTEKQMAFLRGLADAYLWGVAIAPIEQFLDDLEACPAVSGHPADEAVPPPLKAEAT